MWSEGEASSWLHAATVFALSFLLGRRSCLLRPCVGVVPGQAWSKHAAAAVAGMNDAIEECTSDVAAAAEEEEDRTQSQTILLVLPPAAAAVADNGDDEDAT